MFDLIWLDIVLHKFQNIPDRPRLEAATKWYSLKQVFLKNLENPGSTDMKGFFF